MRIRRMGHVCRGTARLFVIAVMGAAGIQCRTDRQPASQPGANAASAASMMAVRPPRTWRAQSNREMMAMRDGSEPGPDFTQRFSKHVEQVKMRDGAEIHTEIYTPLDQSGPLPIILVRSPYGLSPDKYGYAAWLREYQHLMKDGYIFVFQDTRGRGASTGQYVSLSPTRDTSIANSTDESTDTYDSIDWIVKNVPRNNGRVGTLGISYGGFLTTRALVNPHPALKAASPQATCADMFTGDDFHHNGAFRLEYAFMWIAAMEAGVNRSAIINRYDNYDRFLELGPLSNINKQIFHGHAPSWNAFDQHPNLDDYWVNGMCSVLPHIQAPVTVPTLNVGGWFDAEDHVGTIEAYKRYEQGDRHGINFLVMGPWFHGGWTFSGGRSLGAIDFASNTAEWYRENVERPWFAHWLKDKPNVDLPEVLAFRTGANEWEHYDAWPPRTGITDTNLYLRAEGALSFDPPTATGTARDQYVSDPE